MYDSTLTGPKGIKGEQGVPGGPGPDGAPGSPGYKGAKGDQVDCGYGVPGPIGQKVLMTSEVLAFVTDAAEQKLVKY